MLKANIVARYKASAYNAKLAHDELWQANEEKKRFAADKVVADNADKEAEAAKATGTPPMPSDDVDMHQAPAADLSGNKRAAEPGADDVAHQLAPFPAAGDAALPRDA